MLPYHCYAIPDREEPGFRKAQKEVLSILEKERSTSQIIDLLYKELEENKDNIAKEFLAFVSKECNPQRKVRFAEVSYAHSPYGTERIPFSTFSRRLITKEEPITHNPIETTEDDSDDSWDL
jgi:hypothetical protein